MHTGQNESEWRMVGDRDQILEKQRKGAGIARVTSRRFSIVTDPLTARAFRK